MNPLPSSPSCPRERVPGAWLDERSPNPGEVEAANWPKSRAEMTMLVEECADGLVQHAFRRLGSLADAEDVVQDVLVRVLAGGPRVEVSSIRAYLFRAVGNACTDFLRSRTRAERRLDPVHPDRLAIAADGPAECAQAVEEQRRIESLLARLPAEQADAVRLRVLDGLRLDEIAEVLDCPINTVSSRLRYGFQKLRAAVEKEGDDR